MPLDVRHDNEGQPTDHREIHNVYGLLMTRATFEGLLRLRPDERPFVLTRASFAGGQRYAAIWPGDNVSRLGAPARARSPCSLGLGLSGFPFVGSDIGGFAEAPTPELLHALAAARRLLPLHAHAHRRSARPTRSRGPTAPRHEAINRRAIELRYELLPHDLQRDAGGEPDGRAGPAAAVPRVPGRRARPTSCDDEFLFGRDLLVGARAARGGRREREVYLPGGRLVRLLDGQRRSRAGAGPRCRSRSRRMPALRARRRASSSASRSCRTRARWRASRCA